MTNNVKEKLFGHIEIEEGITPIEYDGTNVAFPEFDPGKQLQKGSE